MLYLDLFQNRCYDLGLESHKIGIGILAWTNWNPVRKTSEARPIFCTLCLKEKPSELQIFICNYVPLLSKRKKRLLYFERGRLFKQILIIKQQIFSVMNLFISGILAFYDLHQVAFRNENIFFLLTSSSPTIIGTFTSLVTAIYFAGMTEITQAHGQELFRTRKKSWNQGTSVNLLPTTQQEKAPQGKFLKFFKPTFNPLLDTIRVSAPKIRALNFQER